MSHFPFFNLLQQAFSDSVQADTESKNALQHRQQTRRQFLRDTAITATGFTLLPSFLRANHSSKNQPTIAIIGAGMAGLNAAYQLQKKGIKATIYEASNRVGGRMFTMKDVFGANITTDIGGEFVDTTHTDILALAKELGVDFYDLRTDSLAPKTFYFDGKHLSEEDLRQAIKPFVKKIVQDIASLPVTLSHQTAATFRHLDNLSITQYLTHLGIGGWLFHFLEVVLTREYGMQASQQSAINFLIMFDAPVAAEKDYELFGNTHEVFKIKGGSQTLSDKMYQKVQKQVVLQHQLVAMKQEANQPITLTFKTGTTTQTIVADYVICTIPFSVLRNINLQLPLPEGKLKCIKEIGYGNSCKLVVGVNNKPWRKAGKQGYTFTDHFFGCGWDSSQMQSTEQGSFTVFGGGNFGTTMKQAKQATLVAPTLAALDKVYPGSQAAHNQKNLKFCWETQPFVKAGYSAFKKGQWSTLAGWEAVPVGNVYFAGEHVSREFQGYMNGAAETARVAAQAIVSKILTTHQSPT